VKFGDYQEAARKTDQFPRRGRDAQGSASKSELVPLLGLTGEVGALLSEYKKLLRDGPVHLRFRERLAEELGDTLWYVSSVATKFELSLDDIAADNLRKTEDRWLSSRKRTPFDLDSPRTEKLPRKFEYTFAYATREDGTRGVALLDKRGRQVGDLLTDNAHKTDGYRFHDVMHFAFVAILGWSPVARKLLGRKRRSGGKAKDEVEDGGRASVIDEAIVAMIFDYIDHDLVATEGMTRIDTETLRGVRALTRGYEVHVRTEAEWEQAILAGLDVWRKVDGHNGGTVIGNFTKASFRYAPPPR